MQLAQADSHEASPTKGLDITKGHLQHSQIPSTGAFGLLQSPNIMLHHLKVLLRVRIFSQIEDYSILVPYYCQICKEKWRNLNHSESIVLAFIGS